MSTPIQTQSPTTNPPQNPPQNQTTEYATKDDIRGIRETISEIREAVGVTEESQPTAEIEPILVTPAVAPAVKEQIVETPPPEPQKKKRGMWARKA